MKDDRGELDLTKMIEDLTTKLKGVNEDLESQRELNSNLKRELQQVKTDNVILADDNAILYDRLRQLGR